MRRLRRGTSLAAALLLATTAPGQETIVPVAGDDVTIDRSCVVRVLAPSIDDDEGDGVVRIVAAGVTVRFEGDPLRGAAEGTSPDAIAGVGIVVAAPDVVLVAPSVRGFREGIRVEGVAGVTIIDADVDEGFRQRLRSTAEAEDVADWLRPHDNDAGEWAARYGAAIRAIDASNLEIRGARVRRCQNGIMLERVSDARIYDNDCSFLSGWGLAMWRCTGNLVSRNAFDFCVRGYSHGVYNRGQDSAGILLFEQCSGNRILQNSATHGGDGIFAFSGSEALGERSPREDEAWYRGRGNRDNLIVGNDLSDAAAHGLEYTFGFDTTIADNRFTGNAICGIWAGYSQGLRILRNRFEENGFPGNGLERGAINAEHASRIVIASNRFDGNACGVHFWWDPDDHLAALPWTRVNGAGSGDNVVAYNVFRGDAVGVQLRATTGVVKEAGNTYSGVAMRLDADPTSRERMAPATTADVGSVALPALEPLGTTTPVGARPELAGRRHIVMTEWGPLDPAEPALVRTERRGQWHAWRLLGAADPTDADVVVEGEVVRAVADGRIQVRAKARKRLAPYRILVTSGDRVYEAEEVVANLMWHGRVFRWSADPIADRNGWRNQSYEGWQFHRPDIAQKFGAGGPASTQLIAELEQSDRFGIAAEAEVTAPPGVYRIRTVSDDGIHVSIDGETVIEDWTQHAPRTHHYDLVIDEERTFLIEVEYFELDGNAELTVEFVPVPPGG